MKTPLFLIFTALFIVGCTAADIDTQESVPEDIEPLVQESEQESTAQDPVQEDAPEETTELVQEDTPQEIIEDVIIEEFAGITREEIAERNTRQDCWVAYQGQVYDLTEWIRQHPGGANAIAPHCGTVEQFERAYDQRHGARDDGLLRTEPMGSLAG